MDPYTPIQTNTWSAKARSLSTTLTRAVTTGIDWNFPRKKKKEKKRKIKCIQWRTHSPTWMTPVTVGWVTAVGTHHSGSGSHQQPGAPWASVKNILRKKRNNGSAQQRMSVRLGLCDWEELLLKNSNPCSRSLFVFFLFVCMLNLLMSWTLPVLECGCFYIFFTFFHWADKWS